MKNLIEMLSLAVFALVAIGVAHAADSVVGKWKTQFDSQIGTQKYTYEFKMTDGQLGGRAIGERDTGTNDVALTDIKIDKDKISFAEPLKIQDNDVSVQYAGTIAGDELKLHRKVGEFAEYDIVAKRVKETAAADGDGSKASVAGKWQGQFESQIGVQKYTYEFKVDGTNLTGTAVGISDNGTNSAAISEGKIAQDTISFVEAFKFAENEIRIQYTGKLSGSEIKLHRKVGEIAEEDLTVKRVDTQP